MWSENDYEVFRILLYPLTCKCNEVIEWQVYDTSNTMLYYFYNVIVGEQHFCPSSLMMVEYVLNPIAQCNKALASLLIGLATTISSGLFYHKVLRGWVT